MNCRTRESIIAIAMMQKQYGTFLTSESERLLVS